MELNYNRVHLCGQAEDVPTLSHVNHGCAFYRFTLAGHRYRHRSAAVLQ